MGWGTGTHLAWMHLARSHRDSSCWVCRSSLCRTWIRTRGFWQLLLPTSWCFAGQARGQLHPVPAPGNILFISSPFNSVVLSCVIFVFPGRAVCGLAARPGQGVLSSPRGKSPGLLPQETWRFQLCGFAEQLRVEEDRIFWFEWHPNSQMRILSIFLNAASYFMYLKNVSSLVSHHV